MPRLRKLRLSNLSKLLLTQGPRLLSMEEQLVIWHYIYVSVTSRCFSYMILMDHYFFVHFSFITYVPLTLNPFMAKGIQLY
jgi:hypothetical protein